MNIRLAYPAGFDLDPSVIEQTKANCAAAGSSFDVTHDQEEAYEEADVVYSRQWMHPGRYDKGREFDVEESKKHSDWRATPERMRRTSNALFIHPMPIDRGNEADDEVCDSDRSIIYDIAENRLHVQKAIMALTMAE
jgi:N-acetylornithine carbamoyltransferase